MVRFTSPKKSLGRKAVNRFTQLATRLLSRITDRLPSQVTKRIPGVKVSKPSRVTGRKVVVGIAATLVGLLALVFGTRRNNESTDTTDNNQI